MTATIDQNGKIIPFPSKPLSTNDYLAKAIALNQVALAMIAPETRVEQPDLSVLLEKLEGRTQQRSAADVVDLCAWAQDRGYDEIAAEMRDNELTENMRAARAELVAALDALKREAFGQS